MRIFCKNKNAMFDFPGNDTYRLRQPVVVLSGLKPML